MSFKLYHPETSSRYTQDIEVAKLCNMAHGEGRTFCTFQNAARHAIGGTPADMGAWSRLSNGPNGGGMSNRSLSTRRRGSEDPPLTSDISKQPGSPSPDTAAAHALSSYYRPKRPWHLMAHFWKGCALDINHITPRSLLEWFSPPNPVPWTGVANPPSWRRLPLQSWGPACLHTSLMRLFHTFLLS